MLFHHDPGRTDPEVDEIVATFAKGTVAVAGAMQRTVLDLPE